MARVETSSPKSRAVAVGVDAERKTPKILTLAASPSSSTSSDRSPFKPLWLNHPVMDALSFTLVGSDGRKKVDMESIRCSGRDEED